MIPIFQDDFDETQIEEQKDAHIVALLEYDGVPLLNRRGAFYEASVNELARLIVESSRAR